MDSFFVYFVTVNGIFFVTYFWMNMVENEGI